MFLCLGAIQAQDIIIKKDGKRVEGQIIERTNEYVIIKGSNGGENNAIPISEIEKIEADTENASNYAGNKQGQDNSNEEYTKNFGKNIVNLNLMEFGILLNVNLSYERILSEGYLGLLAGYSISMENTSTGNLSSALYNYSQRYNFDINIYPTGQHRVSYFLGPSLIYGIYDEEDPVNSDEFISKEYTSFLINNGVMISVSPNFGVSTKLGLGVVRKMDESGYQGIEVGSPLFSFAMSLRF